MTDRCLAAEELGDLEALPAGDPRRSHVEACPRCRVLLRSYLEFLSPPDLPAEARAGQAGAALTAALRREIFDSPPSEAPAAGSGLAVPLAPAPVAARGPADRSRPRFSILDLFRPPVLTPVLAVAAVVVVAVGLQQFWLHRAGTSPTGTLRGTGSVVESEIGASQEPGDDGAWHLSWHSVEGAGAYQVVLYGAELTEVARIDAGSGTELTLRPADVPALAAQPDALFWRVVGLRGGDEIARSQLLTLNRAPR